MRNAASLFLLSTLFGVGCAGGGPVVVAPNPRIGRSGPAVTYAGQLFTGVIESRHSNGRLAVRTPYRDGQKDGVEEFFHANGRLAARRPYAAGRKEGVHQGWHEAGQVRFYLQFKHDRFINENWAWFPDGRPANFFRYDAGGERLLGMKQWRADGKIFINYVAHEDPRIGRVGLYGGKLCKKITGGADGETQTF